MLWPSLCALLLDNEDYGTVSVASGCCAVECTHAAKIFFAPSSRFRVLLCIRFPQEMGLKLDSLRPAKEVVMVGMIGRYMVPLPYHTVPP